MPTPANRYPTYFCHNCDQPLGRVEGDTLSFRTDDPGLQGQLEENAETSLEGDNVEVSVTMPCPVCDSDNLIEHSMEVQIPE